jgi:DNA replication protein DnaC
MARRDREVRHPGASPQCPLCAGLGGVVVAQGEVSVVQTCSCVGRCPHCRDTGFVAQSDAFRARRQRCVCQEALARFRAFEAVSVPARHASSTRATFQAGNRQQTVVLGAVSKYLANFEPGQDNRGLILYGDVGRGKTHLLAALLRELVLTKGVRARFVEFSHLLADLKAGFDTGQGSASRIDPLVDIEVLGIDELGKGRATDFEGTVIDEIVSRRYNAMRPIVATTNFAPGGATGSATANAAERALGTGSAPSLRDRVGDRVYSRLRETCDFVPVLGEDYRERRRRPGEGS